MARLPDDDPDRPALEAAHGAALDLANGLRLAREYGIFGGMAGALAALDRLAALRPELERIARERAGKNPLNGDVQ